MTKNVTKDIEKLADIGTMKDVIEKGVVPIYTEKHMNQEINTNS